MIACEARIGVIGLGYVGLPLAVELGRKFTTVGFDLKSARIAELREGRDSTGEVDAAAFTGATTLTFSSDPADLASCNVYIVAVPTPIDSFHQPNLRPLIGASETIAKVISKGDVVIYESTVYPGATEGDCIPVIERISGLRYNVDFFAGYSPERINPGDKTRTLTKIMKVTSGSTPEVADFVDAIYSAIIEAGTFKASSIRVAEAAKIIENTQRDVNIALINELSIMFSHFGIDTNEVLDAAATKWNFINLRPGLVGGHCIGVDPYYLVHKSIAVGHIPDIIRLAREINDSMPRHAASLLVKAMIAKGARLKGARVLIEGFTFKENCPDIRNTKVIDLVQALAEYGIACDIHDDWAEQAEVDEEYSVTLIDAVAQGATYDAVVLAVAHKQAATRGAAYYRSLLAENGVFFDMKAAFPAPDSDLRL